MWISRFHIEKFDFEFRLDIVKFVYEHICTIVLTVLYCLFVNILKTKQFHIVDDLVLMEDILPTYISVNTSIW